LAVAVFVNDKFHGEDEKGKDGNTLGHGLRNTFGKKDVLVWSGVYGWAGSWNCGADLFWSCWSPRKAARGNQYKLTPLSLTGMQHGKLAAALQCIANAIQNVRRIV
jgi:hypothetical protein